MSHKLLLTEADGFRTEELADTGQRTANTWAVRVYIAMIEHKEPRSLEAVKNPRYKNYTAYFLLIERNCKKSPLHSS
jgi:hypothetical protein